MYRLIPTLALLLAASGSQAVMTASPLGIEPAQTLDQTVSIESGALTALRLGRGTDAGLQLAQGPRGPGGPDDGPRDYRGPGGGPGGYGGPGPYGPGYGPGGPGYYPGPGPGPRPAPPPDPGPAGIIPHILPLLLLPPSSVTTRQPGFSVG
jgi:hypothetical protein